MKDKTPKQLTTKEKICYYIIVSLGGKNGRTKKEK